MTMPRILAHFAIGVLRTPLESGLNKSAALGSGPFVLLWAYSTSAIPLAA